MGLKPCSHAYPPPVSSHHQTDEPDILTTSPVDEKNKFIASINGSVFKTHRDNCMARLKNSSEGKLRTFQ